MSMDVTLYASFLPHTDPDASLVFYRDSLGFGVRHDVGHDGMRRNTCVVLQPPTEAERRTIDEMTAKGVYAGIILATADLDATFARLQAIAAVTPTK